MSGMLEKTAAAPLHLRGARWLRNGTLNIPPVIGRAAALYVILVVVLSTQSSQFLTTGNAQVIATQVAVLGIVSLGHMLVLVAGGFDLSISGVIPLAAVVYVKVANTSLGTVPAIVVALICGSLVGALNGIVVTRLRVNPLITTLGTLSIGQGLAYLVSSGSTIPMKSISSSFIANDTPLGVPIFVLVFFGIVVLMFVVLRWTVAGRAVFAVGGSREAARLAGMRVDLVQTATFIVSGTLAALAGIVLASQLLAGSANLATDMTLNSLTAVVLGGAALHGGVGSVPGTVLGVLILGTLTNGLALLQISTYYQLIATGCVLVLTVSLAQVRLPSRVLGIRRNGRSHSRREVTK